MHAVPAPPSPWVTRFAPLIRPGGPVLDLAAGLGRHGRMFLDRGHPVTMVDRDIAGLSDAAGAEVIAADLEDGSPWPLVGRRFAGIVVTNYLHRPLFPLLAESLEKDGVLIYETFALGNEQYGRPRNPDHLLKTSELIDLLHGRLTILAFEQGRTPKPSVVQRICAIRGDGPAPLA
ncbi:bifunctional 2-polyprenyl-6-hydroxyphenol methylase/3-demethylubiquinol 3-O-methyltransferase UbiG [Telmatospirillum sp. J64-1]|uniref:class I SAM-dependent methyltransferase n=1 Tax=Telmatospirillum sp. J64-1 TaxID=2502183 RepID=UPI00115F374A|nr:class I SAM-dependent methyltransferase [Telmatospirillum sp. J64-1]